MNRYFSALFTLFESITAIYGITPQELYGFTWNLAKTWLEYSFIQPPTCPGHNMAV